MRLSLGKMKWWAIYIQITKKCRSQTTLFSEQRYREPGNVFNTLCSEGNPQVWHRVLKPSSLSTTIRYWDWALARSNGELCLYMYIYTYVYIERKRQREKHIDIDIYLLVFHNVRLVQVIKYVWWFDWYVW